jgi:hypothetical protein
MIMGNDSLAQSFCLRRHKVLIIKQLRDNNRFGVLAFRLGSTTFALQAISEPTQH